MRYTNSTADWLDVIKLQPGSQTQYYQTPGGEKEYSYNNEVIKIKGKADHIMLVKETQWGPLMAGALLGSIPVAIVYSFFVEHYVSGLTGSVKG